MIHDAKVEVTCDGERCGESIEIQPEYVYTSYAGTGGHYDCTEKSLEQKIEAEGWKVNDGKHFCESCGDL